MNTTQLITATALIVCLCGGAQAQAQQEEGPDYKHMYEGLLIERGAQEARFQVMIHELEDKLAATRQQLEQMKAENQAMREHVQQSEQKLQRRVRGEAESFQIEHAQAGDIADVLQATFGGDVRVAVIDSNNALVVRAREEQLKQIKLLLDKIDRKPSVAEVYTSEEAAARTLLVTIDFIQATAGSSERGALPDHLREVASAVRDSGLGNLRPYGHLMARAKTGERFESNGLVASGLEATPAFVKIHGVVELPGQGKRAELTVSSTIRAPLQQPVRGGRDGGGASGTRVGYEHFGIETTATVPLGDYVVLGAIPAKLENSDTVLMVIRITEG